MELKDLLGPIAWMAINASVYRGTLSYDFVRVLLKHIVICEECEEHFESFAKQYPEPKTKIEMFHCALDLHNFAARNKGAEQRSPARYLELLVFLFSDKIDINEFRATDGEKETNALGS